MNNPLSISFNKSNDLVTLTDKINTILPISLNQSDDNSNAHIKYMNDEMQAYIHDATWMNSYDEIFILFFFYSNRLVETC